MFRLSRKILRAVSKQDRMETFTKDIVKCVISLIGDAEVSAKNCGNVIQIVCQNLFGIKLKDSDIPSERSSLRFADQGHILANQQMLTSIVMAPQRIIINMLAIN